jgi:hypothetical protein
MLITTPPAIPLDWLPLPVNPFIPAIQVSLPTPMPAPEFLATLDRLIHACPDIWLDKRTMKVCLDELSNIPAGLLRHFASQHICTSPYFPCISGQHLIARQLSGTANFASLSSPVVDYLELQAFRVSNFCFQHGELAPYEWHRLARLLENVGHSCWLRGCTGSDTLSNRFELPASPGTNAHHQRIAGFIVPMKHIQIRKGLNRSRAF